MITKFKSQNLLGEIRKVEERRLLDARIRARLQGKDPLVIREIKRGGKGYLAGTTAYQRKLRRRILRGQI